MSGSAVLALEDGAIYWGEQFGARLPAGGEVVFNTAMTGYQEVATDASYNGQIVVLTYPMIGSYGAFARAAESRQPWVEALVVRELRTPERAGVHSIDAYLAEHGVPGIAGVDTRSLVRRLRSRGTMRGYLTPSASRSGDSGVAADAVRRARAVVTLEESPVVSEVVGPGRTVFGPADGPQVALVDTGVKENQIRLLTERGATVRLFDVAATASEILGWQPSGIVLSNGPGDPAALGALGDTVRELMRAAVASAGLLPMLGICLGHQIVGRAIGATTSRLRFGHHGANHPVRDTRTGRVFITSQNHEFQVDEASIPTNSGFFVSHRNLNDGSVEGLAHRDLPILTVQFHPEGAPGPRDTEWIFDDFIGQVRR